MIGYAPRETRNKAHDRSFDSPEKCNSSSTILDTNVPQNGFLLTTPTVPPSRGNKPEAEMKAKKITAVVGFWKSCKSIMLASYLNIFLLLVPAGIAAKFINLDPGIVFGINAGAIVPLAGLLSYATESVAHRMGDTVGALMNVTFGNAVELIIFIALQKGEIRIVQASLLGSILANLLLILGMCFLIGGLKYLEQLYNSKVTQLSACLLSLSVMSLLLPTAFHASFSELQEIKARSAVLKVSRGTSVVLLIVYGMYLLFQLKSHAYMYERTPQHLIDEEAAPGPVAAWIEHANASFSTSESDSDVSDTSHFTTTRRVKRMIRRRSTRRRKSSYTSTHLHDALQSPNLLQQRPSGSTVNLSPRDREFCPSIRIIETAQSPEDNRELPSSNQHRISITDHDDHPRKKSHSGAKRKKKRRKSAYTRSKNPHDGSDRTLSSNTIIEKDTELSPRIPPVPKGSGPGKTSNQSENNTGSKRSFPLFLVNLPNIPKSLSQNVFVNPFIESSGSKNEVVPNIRYGVRRTNSLPNNLNEPQPAKNRDELPTNLAPLKIKVASANRPPNPEENENVSRTTSIFLLLISTGLVALCAEFMVGSINDVVRKDSVLSEAFIGLIILPIVGNAAEHVTAVTVAAKNKMDLAIGVAIGSSIQIALFVTPFVVLLGWAMNKELSLFFTLFETVSLFVSAFIVNFLVLDGKSNYLEGALLCAAYIMIAVAAFFYPSIQESSSLGGNAALPKNIERAGNLVAGFI